MSRRRGLPNIPLQRTGRSRRSHPAAERERWADQSESATTMTTEAVIVGRGGGLLTWDGRL